MLSYFLHDSWSPYMRDLLIAHHRASVILDFQVQLSESALQAKGSYQDKASQEHTYLGSLDVLNTKPP